MSEMPDELAVRMLAAVQAHTTPNIVLSRFGRVGLSIEGPGGTAMTNGLGVQGWGLARLLGIGRDRKPSAVQLAETFESVVRLCDDIFENWTAPSEVAGWTAQLTWPTTYGNKITDGHHISAWIRDTRGTDIRFGPIDVQEFIEC
jgi:hypothetical protein